MYEDTEFLKGLEEKYKISKKTEYESHVNFQEAINQPYQRWYPYREGYSYLLIDKIISDNNIKGNLLDPFVGSGSSLLAGRKNGLRTFGIDVNPLSAFISNVENRIYSDQNITDIEEIQKQFLTEEQDKKYRKTNFDLATKYFNHDILQSLLQFKENIQSIEDNYVRDIFYLSWLSILESVSNVKKEGNGLKYRNRKRNKKGYINIPIEEWEKEKFPENKFEYIKSELLSKIYDILFDLRNYPIEAAEPKIYVGDSIDITHDFDDVFQLTIFSPPYVNFFDYFEIHKIELWMGDFVDSRTEFSNLKKTGFRSTSSALGYKEISYKNKSVEHLVSLISEKKLWSNKIPEVIEGYFDDMQALLINIFNKTEQNGYVCIIVGNSAYGGILVPTDLLIAEIAENIGFSVEEIIEIRHLTTSPQQRTKLNDVLEHMRESIIVLKKKEY